MATKVSTAWGGATVLDEVTVPQRAGDKRFASVVQLLTGANGDRYVRFAYTTDGIARRGPVTLRAQDVARFVEALPAHPELASALPLGPRQGAKRGRRRGK